MGVLHSLRPVVPHTQFQAEARAQLVAHYPDLAVSLRPWDDDLRLVWQADLDFADSVLRPLYSPVGCPVTYDPKALFRSLLLCHQRGFRSLTLWALQLRREPVLAILSGFHPDRTPTVGLFYAFLDRLYPLLPARRLRGIVRRHRRVAKPPSGQKLPPGRGKLARCASWLLRHLAECPASTPEDIWDALLAEAVGSSARQGILPTESPLAAAADGSLLRSGAHSHGHKACACSERRCSCPRFFSDPTARVGYDSTNNCFLLGRSAYALTDTDSGHHLPLILTMGPANRHDALGLMYSLRKARHCLHRAGVSLGTAFADSAHDHAPVYRFLIALGLEPVFDRHGKLPQPLPAVIEHLTRAGLTLSPEGRPRCAHGFLHSAGHARPGVRLFQCPRRDPDNCPCSGCPLRDGRRWTIDVRQQPRLLAVNPQTEPAGRRRYKRRTNVERTFSLITSASGLDTARHRRDYVWHGRLAVAAILVHARVWSRSDRVSTDDWLTAWAQS